MRVYETTFIVNPQTDDATIEQRVAAVSDLIAKGGGHILDEDRMGTRRLAYPIEKLTQGYYHTLVYEAPQDVLPQLDRMFSLNEAYLRHLTILYEGDASKLRREHPAEEKEAEPAAEETTETEEPSEPTPERVTVAQTVPTGEPAEAEEKTEEPGPEEAEGTAEEAAPEQEQEGEAGQQEDETEKEL